MTRQLLGWGWRVVRVDLRGSGRGISLARKPYHAGCSDDIRAVLAALRQQAPASPLVLVGYSLGGNIVLKLAGEARDHPVPGLAAVAAINPPIDLVGASAELARHRLYEQHLVRGLMALARQRARHFPGHRQRFPRRLSLFQFDDLYTAPRVGFAGALDYYTRASALPWIQHIQAPTLILTSRDDPLVPVTPFLDLAAPPGVEVRIASGGGHLGFLGWDGIGGVRWVDRRILDWLANLQERAGGIVQSG
jgi:predicted alpha/beta-fold hydrolase